MFKKFFLVASAATSLAVLGYVSMAFAVVLKSDPATVLTMNASEQLPLTARIIAEWRVQSWDGCPTLDRRMNVIAQTLRGYGLEGFENDRVLATASHLIALGCDVNELSQTGQAPIHEAILYNEPDVVRFLLANGADPSVQIHVPDGQTSESLRHYSGMNAQQFAADLNARAASAERSEILILLKYHRS